MHPSTHTLPSSSRQLALLSLTNITTQGTIVPANPALSLFSDFCPLRSIQHLRLRSRVLAFSPSRSRLRVFGQAVLALLSSFLSSRYRPRPGPRPRASRPSSMTPVLNVLARNIFLLTLLAKYHGAFLLDGTRTCDFGEGCSIGRPLREENLTREVKSRWNLWKGARTTLKVTTYLASKGIQKRKRERFFFYASQDPRPSSHSSSHSWPRS